MHRVEFDVVGPWSLATSRRFWEGFAPAALAGQDDDGVLRTVFLSETDWTRVAATIEQRGDTAVVTVEGPGDLDAAAAQVQRFLAIDVDARAWPEVGARDPIIASAQAALPGFRPCGFHSPYEAAAWAVISQRIGIAQGGALRARLTAEYGDDGAFPAPARLRSVDLGTLDLPGRKAEYLHHVADAALAGVLSGPALRALDPVDAVARVRTITGLGPFGSELVVLRGANAPDALPTSEPRVTKIVRARYGRELPEVAEAWRPFRTWACVHLRASA